MIVTEIAFNLLIINNKPLDSGNDAAKTIQKSNEQNFFLF